MVRWKSVTVVGLASLAGACGSKGEPAEAAASEASSGREREESAGQDGLSVSGLRGTLSPEEVQNALEPRMPKLSRCVQKRSGDVEWLSGAMQLEFHVALDGSVTDVYPTSSSMGDRDTERCVLEVAKNTRFPAPHGGEADFGWSFDVPLDSETRPPVEGTGADVVSARASEVTSQCGPGPYSVTAYIDPNGKVVAAGAATRDAASAKNLDCVTQAIAGWTFASPGSYAAKITFDID